MKFSEVCIFKGVTAYIHILQVLIEILLAKFQKAPAYTVKILEFGTPQTIAIIVLKIEMFDITLH